MCDVTRRRGRQAFSCLWSGVLCAYLASLLGALGQTCGPEYISWPREQCTQDCPNAESMKCGYDTTMHVEISDTHYCCVCVPDLKGRYRPLLCPGSAVPRPPQIQVSYNGTIHGRAREVTVHVPAGTSLTSYVDIVPDFSSDSLFNYLEVSIASVVQISNASGNGKSKPNNATASRRLRDVNGMAFDVDDAQLVITAGMQQGDGIRVSSKDLHAAVPWPGSQASAVAPVGGALGKQVAQYAARGLHGGEPRHLWTDEAVDIRAQSGHDEAGARRSGAEAQGLEWYLQEGGPPQLDPLQDAGPFDSLPFYMYQGKGEGRIPILRSMPDAEAEAAQTTYVMGMRGNKASYRVTVKANSKSAVQLQNGVSSRVSLDANERVFTYFRPQRSANSAESAAFKQGVVFLDIKVEEITNASMRVFVGMNYLSTARKWIQWVGGTDAELNAVPDRFYTANLMVVSSGDDYTSWTIESSKPSNLVLTPRAVHAEPLTPEMPREFVISQELGMALFMLKPTVNRSRVFFQLMPSRQMGSREAYARWEDLQAACRIMAVTKVNGDWAYFQLSDWGYTTDGTPGLQVMISQWDYGATMYLHVYLRRTAPNPAFTVVCYVVDDAFESWRWWFGGIFFALIFFCIARCVLGRSPHGQYFGSARRSTWGRRNGGMESGGAVGMELQQPLPRVVATTTEPPPSKLIKVGDTLYSRTFANVNSGAQSAELGARAGGPSGRALPIGPMFVGVDDAEDDTDASCSICMDRAPDAVLLECGHGGVCMPCAESLWNSGADGRLCPMCRKAITGIVKIIGETGCEVSVQVVHYSQATPSPSSDTRPVSAQPSLMRRLSGGFIPRRWSRAAQGAPPASLAPVLVEVRNQDSSSVPTTRPRPNDDIR